MIKIIWKTTWKELNLKISELEHEKNRLESLLEARNLEIDDFRSQILELEAMNQVNKDNLKELSNRVLEKQDSEEKSISTILSEITRKIKTFSRKRIVIGSHVELHYLVPEKYLENFQ